MQAFCSFRDVYDLKYMKYSEKYAKLTVLTGRPLKSIQISFQITVIVVILRKYTIYIKNSNNLHVQT